MACNQWNDQWVARLYDELDPAEDRRLTAHLESCAACRETLEALTGTRRLLRDATPAVPPAPRVMVLQPRGLRRPLWAFAAGLAAAAALFAVALYALPVGPTARVAELQARLDALEHARPAGDAAVTRGELEAELARWARQVDVGRAQDVEYLIGEIQALEHRNRRQLNDNRDTLLRVAMDGTRGLKQF